jgi:hypothetical protein
MAVSQRIHALKSSNVLHALFTRKRRLADQHGHSFDLVPPATFGGVPTQIGPRIFFLASIYLLH